MAKHILPDSLSRRQRFHAADDGGRVFGLYEKPVVKGALPFHFLKQNPMPLVAYFPSMTVSLAGKYGERVYEESRLFPWTCELDALETPA